MILAIALVGELMISTTAGVSKGIICAFWVANFKDDVNRETRYILPYVQSILR